jgi:uncharacterized protein
MVVEDDLGALGREGACARRADPAGGAGDEDALAGEPGLHCGILPAVTEEVREWMTWSDLGTAVEDLAALIDADGFRPDAVLALARGGLPLAGALAYALGVKNMATLNVEFYTGVDERLDEPLLLPPVPDLTLLRTERLLVADDVADTGRTLALARDFCAQHGPEVRTAVLYEKPRSVVRCDFVWRRTDRWINFPWSTPSRAGAAAT